MTKEGVLSQNLRRAFLRASICLVLGLALLGSTPRAIGVTTTSDIKILIEIVRGYQGSRSNDSIRVKLTPSLTLIANSGVTVNSIKTPENRVEGRIHRHDGLFPTAVQNIKIYIQKEGDPPFPFRADISSIKPNASAVIDVPDNLALASPASYSSTTRPVRDVDLQWKSWGPATTYQVKVEEDISNRVAFIRDGVSGNHLLIPASTFEAGKRYCFLLIGIGRSLGKPSGSCAPSSSIYINTYDQCFITFTAK